LSVFGPEHFEKVIKGIDLFNKQFYWECHEELEHHWLEDRGDNARYVYWAIIQVAASMYHVRNSNKEGAFGLLKKAKEKIDFCEKNYIESQFLLQNLNWQEFKDKIRAAPNNGELSELDELYNFRFSGKGVSFE
jgi:predicted metal-dependent hydrolase